MTDAIEVDVLPGRHEDQEAIDDLRTAFQRQGAAFAKDRSPSLDQRRTRLEALVAMMLENREAIATALVADFGAHPEAASDIIEVMGVVGRAQYVLANLEAWMAPEPRDADPSVFGTARASVRFQPKGVIGNIVPWNFPFDLSVGPLVEVLAAGNRAIVKPSEYTPACGALLAAMVDAAFAPDLVHVVRGGRVLSEAFAAMPWDHLLYTGGPAVGRQVMAAAARNLTPVTLELGGKCPVLLTPGTVNARNVGAIIGAKLIKNGQMCVSVDHVMVHRDELDAFVDFARSHMDRTAPDYASGSDCTGIVSNRHRQRLAAMLDEASARRVRIVMLGEGEGRDRSDRRMGLSLLIDPPSDLAVMREEIFGPILPVVPYDDLDKTVMSIASGDRPLGLYVFADEALAETILDRTHSGGATVNGCAMQSALPSLGFGGSGTSGMGRHHGIDGYREFSNPRGVVIRGEHDMVDAFFPPYPARSEGAAS